MTAAETSFEDEIEAVEDDMDDDFESVGDHHRAAAAYFSAAARHHLAAAEAEDAGETEAADRHAYLAYRQRLNGAQYAEIAVMDSERIDEVVENTL